jgi:release factor glutamine methyltransferase
MTIQEARQRMVFQLYDIYDNREAGNIADLVMENITGWKKIDRILNKQVPLSGHQLALFNQYTSELLSHRPVQYILQEAWFAGLKFYVDEHVLIPRPETEELVEWIIADLNASQPDGSFTLLDIGTGSGCIAIALKKKLRTAAVFACDLSPSALAVAGKNSTENSTSINLLELDFLDESQWQSLPHFDVIVSNPPYIPSHEQPSMNRNVVDFEPHLALFVQNDDPLIFYRKIAEFGNQRLTTKGKIYVEIHENLAEEVQQLFTSRGFRFVETKNDMQGKARMIKAIR